MNPWAPPISYKFIICSAWFSALLFYKMLKEVRAPWLVRTSSLYLLKARALRHTSALLRYNARSLRHWYDIFYERNKKTCSSSIVELYKHLGIFKNTREVREALTLGSCFSALLSCSQKFPRAYITQQCTRCVFYFFNNGSGLEWSPIRYVITRMIYKIGRPQSGSPIC